MDHTYNAGPVDCKQRRRSGARWRCARRDMSGSRRVLSKASLCARGDAGVGTPAAGRWCPSQRWPVGGAVPAGPHGS